MIAHRPVMVTEILSVLRPAPTGVYIDATIGEGGHAEAILDASAPSGVVIGLDRDPEILALARELLAPFGPRLRLHAGDYRELLSAWPERGIDRVDGVLIDLGLSSYHLEQPERGFSFRSEGPLDMRFDRSRGQTAAELISRLPETALTQLLQEQGEERWARRIARAIVTQRRLGPIATTRQLAGLIERAVPPPARRGRIHPATRTFQALRIAVNHELDGLDDALEQALQRLAPGGTLCVLAYHSLEDRVIKQRFRAWAAEGRAQLVTKRPLRPSPEEAAENPRARSAKLRAVRQSGTNRPGTLS
ncbi:MAG: 16S rRNA (cytosine(1402)-N(4))-methyltransferase RsmH [Nitrospirota bacterium]